ncbi:MAG: SDR family NAD(P)-dependent oxidoreductase [Candidatus Ratteibacteria bacterium]|jgi:dTDP-L-rhamnose 4-epimerase
MKILVTGGAGFIGSHLTDLLVKKGYDVRIFDNLEPQVHQGKKPKYLNPAAEFVRGDIRNYDRLQKALAGCEAVFHLASAVGVGQSQYQVEHYVDINTRGTATLFDVLVNRKNKVEKIIVAASMSSYGEGLYRCKKCGVVKPGLRPEKQLIQKDWEPRCPECGSPLKSLATSEKTPFDCNSIYALTKKTQEEIALMLGKTYRIPTVSLRFFNVYGSRQSLSNPYTGVTAIFLSRLKNNRPPVVYEDGRQTRDFISVSDVCRALVLSLENKTADYEIFNIGSGRPVKIAEIARILAKALRKRIEPEITKTFRKGDVRHCFADISKIRKKLGWQPTTTFENGMQNLIAWARKAPAEDRFLQAEAELSAKNLI